MDISPNAGDNITQARQTFFSKLEALKERKEQFFRLFRTKLEGKKIEEIKRDINAKLP
jgi:hypothetical protein